ncbi:MAG TPA: DUF2007 domain-containing protein [Usitatibacter sp.]|nr:DUF2007 domain-containing protein [Usitatibacter sp.]
MKRVFSASNLPQAQLLVDHLGGHGIRARILNANAASLAGELPIDASLPQVWVEDAEQAPRARQLIDDYLRVRPLGRARHCAHCGEENPSSFETCWACGTELPPGA